MKSALLLLLIATLPSTGPSDGAQRENGAMAQASANIRIVSGVRVTPAAIGRRIDGAQQREAVLDDADGVRRPANLIEFE